MKKRITLLFIGSFLSISFLGKAQQFWIEDWTTGGSLPQGTLTYTGTNGAWTIQQTGANGADSNAWYFSTQEEGMGRGICGQTGSPASAHMGITPNAQDPVIQLAFSGSPDEGAFIDDASGSPSNTNLRLQSPVINCTGKSNIVLSFNYIEGKSGGNDSATLWYYNGAAWSRLPAPAQQDSCPSQGQGLWARYSTALPASANGNANVKIGFNWSNNNAGYDDAHGVDMSAIPIVSFAVDSIILSTTAAAKPVAIFSISDTSICKGDTVRFMDASTNTPTSWKWYFENGNPSTSTKKDTDVIYNTVGYDSVKLVVKNAAGSDSITKLKIIHVKNCLGTGIENIPDNNTISIYPNPANNMINLAFKNTISGDAKVDITDITGRVISTQVLNSYVGRTIAMNVSGMATGMYIVKLTVGNNIYFEKFIKQ
jgi:PKD repeat protein